MAAPRQPNVSLKHVAGLPNEGLLRASIAAARITADYQQPARYLHFHLDGNTLNKYLRLQKQTERPG